MRYDTTSDLRETGTIGRVYIDRLCTQCGNQVVKLKDGNSIDATPIFCAHCGHKFVRIEESVRVSDMIQLLNAAREEPRT